MRRVASFAGFLSQNPNRFTVPTDEEAERRLKERVPPRNSSYVRSAPSIIFTVRFFKRIGSMGAQARIDNSTKQQRREWARHAAITRWRKATS